TGGGALLFPVGSAGASLPLFVPGAMITITQQSYKKGLWYPSGIDISGTYEVASVERTEVATDFLGRDLPMYIIVKLVDPETVNSDWAGLKRGGDSWDWEREPASFKIQVAHAGSVVDYSAD